MSKYKINYAISKIKTLLILTNDKNLNRKINILRVTYMVLEEEKMIWTSFPLFSRIFYAFKYRDRTTIVNDILKTLRDSRSGKRKTQLMQTANLNYIQFDKYLRYLLKCGFLRISDKGKIYITEEGSKFLLLLEYRRTLAAV